MEPKLKVDKSVLSGTLRFHLKRILNEKPWLTNDQLSDALKPFCEPGKNPPKREAVRRFLLKNGIIHVELKKKPLISDINKEKRLEFAKKYLKKGPEFWDNIVWSDETMIRSNPKHAKLFHKLHRSIPAKNRPINPKSQNEGPSVMFWGFYSSGGVGPLITVDGKINGEKYKSILENHLIPLLKDNGQNLTFMQDNAPVHTCRLVSQFLVENEVPVLIWPPQSPDLNPIENLWHILKSRRAKKFGPVRTKSDIITQSLEIWNEFGIELCEKLSRSLKKRLSEVIKNKGGPIDY
jgi:transposase